MSKLTYNGIVYNVSSLYSDKDMTGKDLSSRLDMNGIVIHGLCLSNEIPNAQVLPSNLKNTTFISCNLDNVFIPAGNILLNCSNRLFKVDNDGQDWLLSADAKTPLTPLNLKDAQQKGLNTNPALIPKAQAAKVGG